MPKVSKWKLNQEYLDFSNKLSWCDSINFEQVSATTDHTMPVHETRLICATIDQIMQLTLTIIPYWITLN